MIEGILRCQYQDLSQTFYEAGNDPIQYFSGCGVLAKQYHLLSCSISKRRIIDGRLVSGQDIFYLFHQKMIYVLTRILFQIPSMFFPQNQIIGINENPFDIQGKNPIHFC